MSDSSSSMQPRNGGADDETEQGARKGSWLGDLVRNLTGSRPEENGWRESLEELLEEHEIGDAELGPEERHMLSNIISLGEKRIEDVMVPRADIVALEMGLPLQEVVESYLAAPHSRLPIYRENLDDIVGVLHVKDLVQLWGQEGDVDLAPILRQPLVVPPSKPVTDLLVEMRAQRRHFAIVVDEYGGVDGLVTIEDLIEEVVGDIRDEHDTEEEPVFIEHEDGTIEVDSRFELDDFEARVDCDLLTDADDEEIDTLGGFIFVTLGRVPKRGEVVRHDCGLEFEIADADPRRIKLLRVRRFSPSATDGERTEKSGL
ncbi:MAG: hemolysin C [Minwuia thermotolerans]|nr:MAG: hemolysin C [Minwuia thermotolerans]